MHRLACNPGATTLQQCFDEYLPVAPASTEERDTLLSGIPVGTVPHAERNVRGLIQAVRHDVVPFARCSSQKAKVTVSWGSIEDFHFPPPLLQPVLQSLANTGHTK